MFNEIEWAWRIDFPRRLLTDELRLVADALTVAFIGVAAEQELGPQQERRL
jgi:hypothetical protein